MKEKTGSKRTDKYREMNDANLALLAKEGDENAFSELIRKHKSALLLFISQYVKVEQDAEDICQESFKKAFINLSSYDTTYSFNTWLFTIARNTAIDHTRRQNDSSPADSGDESDNPRPEIPDQVLSPEDAMISSQSYDSLINAIENLPDIYRDVARLRFIDEYAYEEIAKTLNLPINTVRTRLHRAKNLLR